MASAEALQVEVAYCPAPGSAEVMALQLPAGATLADALRSSGLLQRHDLVAAALKVGIWSRVRELSTPLRDCDRVEIYRPLQVDPKEARRLRHKRLKRHKTG